MLDMVVSEPEVEDRPAAVSLAFISARTEAAAAENWRQVMEGSVDELVRCSLETPSGIGRDVMSGYKFELVSAVMVDWRLISRMVAVESGDAVRVELGSALMMRKGCVVSALSLASVGERGGVGSFLADAGENRGKAMVFFCGDRSSSSSSSVSISSVCPLTSSIAWTRSDILFCLVRGVSGGNGIAFVRS